MNSVDGNSSVPDQGIFVFQFSYPYAADTLPVNAGELELKYLRNFDANITIQSQKFTASFRNCPSYLHMLLACFEAGFHLKKSINKLKTSEAKVCISQFIVLDQKFANYAPTEEDWNQVETFFQECNQDELELNQDDSNLLCLLALIHLQKQCLKSPDNRTALIEKLKGVIQDFNGKLTYTQNSIPEYKALLKSLDEPISVSLKPTPQQVHDITPVVQIPQQAPDFGFCNSNPFGETDLGGSDNQLPLDQGTIYQPAVSDGMHGMNAPPGGIFDTWGAPVAQVLPAQYHSSAPRAFNPFDDDESQPSHGLPPNRGDMHQAVVPTQPQPD